MTKLFQKNLKSFLKAEGVVKISRDNGFTKICLTFRWNTTVHIFNNLKDHMAFVWTCEKHVLNEKL